MKTDYQIDGQTAVITLTGEIDHHAARRVISAIDDVVDMYMPQKLVLDFSGVGFMDSSGLAIVLGAQRKLAALSGQLVLRRVQRQPLKVLTAAGIARLLTMEQEDDKQ